MDKTPLNGAFYKSDNVSHSVSVSILINLLAPVECGSNFKHMFWIKFMMVPSDNKQLTEPILNQIDVVIWRYYATRYLGLSYQ